MPGLSGSATSILGLSAPDPSAHGLPSTGHSAPNSSESGPFSRVPKFGSSLFDIVIEEVLNEFSRYHPHWLRVANTFSQ